MLTINPFNNEKINEYEFHSDSEVERIIDSIQNEFNSWKTSKLVSKKSLMINLSKVLLKEKENLASLMATEMGKPYLEGIGEIEKCAWVCEYYADNAQQFLEKEVIETKTHTNIITYEPIGIILAIMPWNFPFWQVFRVAVPNIILGNAIVLKHAPNVTGCAYEIEKLFISAGFPKNIIRTINVENHQVKNVIENTKIKAVTLTGSTKAGKEVAKIAGENLKKVVLELGGSDPYIVLEDADLELAVKKCAQSRLLNSGQSCIAAKRLIVQESIYDDFLNLLIEEFKQYKVGNPVDKDTNIGPMARFDLRDELASQVKDSLEKGATCSLGGNIPNDKGAFYNPTILTDLKKGMRAYDEELFGPVACIYKFSSLEEAVELANDSIYGLGSAIFTKDINKAHDISSKIDAGACFVNDFVKSDPRLPFGGVKQSGHGRELSKIGIREFSNIKTTSIVKE